MSFGGEGGEFLTDASPANETSAVIGSGFLRGG